MGIGYKDWRCKQKLHTKEGWSCMTNWIGDIIMNNKWNEEHDWKWQWIVITIVTIAIIFFTKPSQADVYDFPPKDVVTMDVLKADGRSGTFLCPDERWCYIKSLEYEARGAEQYCVSLTMKRNGKVVWHRRYQ